MSAGNAVHSVLAVVAGFIAVVVLSEGTDELLRLAGVMPPRDTVASSAMLLVATVYRTVAGVVGGYVAAALAPGNALGHALVLGVVGLAVSTTGAIVMWGVGPGWYPIALAILALPSAWLGGKLKAKRDSAVQEGGGQR